MLIKLRKLRYNVQLEYLASNLSLSIHFLPARVAELVDALVLGTSAVRRKSSSLFFRTIYKSIKVKKY